MLKKEDRHICLGEDFVKTKEKVNNRKGFNILYPLKVYVSFYFLRSIMALLKKGIVRNRPLHLLLAYCLLLSS